jgi:hypothetical protein
MRLTLITLCSCTAMLAACNRSNSAAYDSTSSSRAGSPAASATAPAQSVAQLNGTWHGITLPKERDTTVGTWTFELHGDTGTVTFPNGDKVPVRGFHVVGDKIMSKMGPWTSPNSDSRGKPVTGDIVEQVRGDSVIGTVVTHLVAKPDSTTAELRIIGTRTKS